MEKKVSKSNSKQPANFAQHAKDTGSIEVQVVDLTVRINGLSEHFKTNAKDFSSRRGLLNMINRRKRFLSYLKAKRPAIYTKLIEDLGLRK